MNWTLDAQQLTALAVAAVLVFWMVGAYNRLVALRNGIGQAWSRIDEALRQRAAAAATLTAALRDPLAAESGALDKWTRALDAAAQAALALSAQPVAAVNAAKWIGAEAAVSAAASRVFSLIAHDSQLSRQPTIAVPVVTWQEASTRLVFARQFFNEAADPYNQAARQFPTRLLVKVFRFGPAGRL